jgi:hypothetical protein
MSFRIGRKGAQHSYPVSRGALALPFAFNYAMNLEAQDLSDASPVEVVWDNAGTNGVESDSAIPPGTIVPITPRVTGRVRVIVTVVAKSFGGELNVGLRAATGGPPVQVMGVVQSIAGGAIATVSFVYDFTALSALLPVGVVTNLDLQLVVLGSDGILHSATMDVQELPLATG